MAWQTIAIRAILLVGAILVCVASPAFAFGFVLGKYGNQIWEWLNAPEMSFSAKKENQ